MSKLTADTLFGSKHMVEIIVFLHNFGPRSKTEIYRVISTSPHMNYKLADLRKAGLIAQYYIHGSRKSMQKLTE